MSFVDVFIQKGFKLIGLASTFSEQSRDYAIKHSLLRSIAGERFPFVSVINIDVKTVSVIAAPSYFLFPETDEESQSRSAMTRYGVKPNK